MARTAIPESRTLRAGGGLSYMGEERMAAAVGGGVALNF